MKKAIFTALMVLSFHMLQAQCFPDRHNTSKDNSWVSCQTKVSPNTNRPTSHWVMYDFGDLYTLGQTHFWNMNVVDQTSQGIREAFLDYSLDGVNWTTWGIFNLDEATSSGFYEGQPGPDLEGVTAQFLLITVLETHGGNCAGFSEIRIETNGITSSVDQMDLMVSNMQAQPNPAYSMTEVEILSESNTPGQLQLTDMNGRSLFQQFVNLSEGVNKFELDVSQFSSGQYLISLKIDEHIKSINLSIINQ